MAQPAPSHLHQHRADPCRTVAANALVTLHRTRRPRCRREADPARKFPPVEEVAAKHFVDQQRRIVRPDPLQCSQQGDPGRRPVHAVVETGGRAGNLPAEKDHPVPFRLHRRDLVLYQVKMCPEPCEFTAGGLSQCATVAGFQPPELLSEILAPRIHPNGIEFGRNRFS